MGHGKYIDPFGDGSSVLSGVTPIAGGGPIVLVGGGSSVLSGDGPSVLSGGGPSVLSGDGPSVPAGEAGNFYRVQAGEVLELQFVVLPGESRDIAVNVDLVGPGAQAHLKGLYLCSGEEKVNFRIVMHHRAPGCKSTQLFNGIAGGSAQVSFDGTIVVAPDAQQTEAYQENHNIVLTESAKVTTKPQLEIYADDVKCSHGATVGQLNEDELFYMRSRGIPEAEARTLQMLSFLSPVIPAGREEEIENAIRTF